MLGSCSTPRLAIDLLINHRQLGHLPNIAQLPCLLTFTHGTVLVLLTIIIVTILLLTIIMVIAMIVAMIMIIIFIILILIP